MAKKMAAIQEISEVKLGLRRARFFWIGVWWNGESMCWCLLVLVELCSQNSPRRRRLAATRMGAWATAGTIPNMERRGMWGGMSLLAPPTTHQLTSTLSLQTLMFNVLPGSRVNLGGPENCPQS